MNYVIKHNMNLNYPAGFKYYVDKKEIRDAYKKKKLSITSYNKNSFVVVDKDDDEPKFSVNRKSNGFQGIFKKNS